MTKNCSPHPLMAGRCSAGMRGCDVDHEGDRPNEATVPPLLFGDGSTCEHLNRDVRHDGSILCNTCKVVLNPQRPSDATPVWFNDPAFLKRVLETIACHPRCPKPIYDLAADALCWARKHETSTPGSDNREGVETEADDTGSPDSLLGGPGATSAGFVEEPSGTAREQRGDGHRLRDSTLSNRVTAEATPACRRCSECVGENHHWLEACNPPAPEGDGFVGFECKHCDARVEMCDDCDGAAEPGHRCEGDDDEEPSNATEWEIADDMGDGFCVTGPWRETREEAEADLARVDRRERAPQNSRGDGSDGGWNDAIEEAACAAEHQGSVEAQALATVIRRLRKEK